MAKFRIAIAAALMLCAFVPVGAQARDLSCNQSLDRQIEALRMLEDKAAKAEAMAQQNPLYEADVGYYTSVLRDARACMKSLSKVVSVSR